MKKKLWLTGFLLIFSVVFSPQFLFADIQMTRGEIQQFSETRTGEWDSYILLKDVYGQNQKILVHPANTLIKRGSQIQPLQELTGGMKVTVLYREDSGNLKASVIKIDGNVRG